jgi:predicted ester cyclase
MSCVNEHSPWSQATTAPAVVHALLAGDVLTLQRLTHSDVVDRNAGAELPTGWAALRERALTVCAALPESPPAVELVCSEGDTAVCRVRTTGSRRGAPEAAEVPTVTVLFVLRFRDGRVSEVWSSSDLTPAAAAGTAA